MLLVPTAVSNVVSASTERRIDTQVEFDVEVAIHVRVNDSVDVLVCAPLYNCVHAAIGTNTVTPYRNIVQAVLEAVR